MDKKEKKQKVLKEAYSSDQKPKDRNFVHQFRGHEAALRIFVGAFQSNDIDEKQFFRVCNALNATTGNVVDVEKYLKESSSFRKLVAPTAEPMSLIIAKTGSKLLLVDDEYQSVGWNLVFDTLFGTGNVIYAAGAKEGLDQLVDENIGLVLLDLRLPDTPDQGMSVLQEIMKKRLDVPVIIFTGEDTVRYQRKCYTEGAFDYFVKDFDEEDKNYLNYYGAFKEVILKALSRTRQADIWRSIQDLDHFMEESGPPYYKDVRHYLKKAYYFLTLDEDSFVARTLISNADITYYGEVIVQCSLAVESIINKLCSDNRNNAIMKTLFGTRDIEDISFGPKLGALRQVKLLDINREQVFQSVNNLRKDCVHPDHKGLLVDQEKAGQVLRQTIDVIKHVLKKSVYQLT